MIKTSLGRLNPHSITDLISRYQVDESGLIGVDSVEAIFETIVANKTETGWMESVSNFFTGNVSN